MWVCGCQTGYWDVSYRCSYCNSTQNYSICNDHIGSRNNPYGQTHSQIAMECYSIPETCPDCSGDKTFSRIEECSHLQESEHYTCEHYNVCDFTSHVVSK